jgi:uncharacterized RDD family membrane protein YckC
LLRRVRAFLIDSSIFAVLLYAWMISLPLLEGSPIAVKIAWLVIPLLIVDPVLVAFSGGSPGHHVMGLRVRDAAQDRNIGIVRSLARTVIRSLLGWLSFVFVLVTQRHQALHDYFTSTVVVLRRPESVPAHEQFAARIENTMLYRYPSKLRRVAVIVLYLVLEFVLLSVLTWVVSSKECLNSHRCSTADFMLSRALSILWLLGFGAIVVLGWRGLLFGVRRETLPQDVSADS